MNSAEEIIEKSLNETMRICNKYDTSPIGSFADFKKMVFEQCVRINTQLASEWIIPQGYKK